MGNSPGLTYAVTKSVYAGWLNPNEIEDDSTASWRVAGTDHAATCGGRQSITLKPLATSPVNAGSGTVKAIMIPRRASEPPG